MDDFLKKNNSSAKTEINFEDKKIEFRMIREKKSTKTYVYNLEKYIKDEAELQKLSKSLMKSLGTSCTLKDTNFGKGYGFSGDFAQRIKTYLIDNKYVTKDDFK
jgi:translation initiation factor 1 (eIF-1/SUI1)